MFQYVVRVFAKQHDSGKRAIRRARVRPLGMELLEGRQLYAADLTLASPLPLTRLPVDDHPVMVADASHRKSTAGQGINLELRSGPAYNPNGGSDQVAKVVVRVTNPNHKAGAFSVRLYWASGPSTSSTFVHPAAEREVTLKPHTGDLAVRFALSEMTPRPNRATHLVAVVNEDHRLTETNLKDNVRATELAPRTFIVRISGWLSSRSSDLDGIDMSSLRTKGNMVIAPPTIRPPVATITGEAMLAHARNSLQTILRDHFATAKDRVILVGHSYGGEIARLMSTDVFASVPGRQAAYGLVLIDPVDFVRAQKGQLDQYRIVQPLPRGLTANRILNISGNPDSHATVRGYQVAKVTVKPSIERLWFGADNQLGTRDDLTHTSIDQSRRVHDAILRFLRLHA